jgi:hypothetical protein
VDSITESKNRKFYSSSTILEGKATPLQALRVPGGWGSQIYRQSAHEGGKVVSRCHRPPLSPRKYSWYSFLLEAESTPGPFGDRNDYVKELIPMTPSGIEPATFRSVVPQPTTPPRAPLVPFYKRNICGIALYVFVQPFKALKPVCCYKFWQV